MSSRWWSYIPLFVFIGMISACASPDRKSSEPAIQKSTIPEPIPGLEDQIAEASALARSLAAMPVQDRLAWPEEEIALPDSVNEQLYSFVAQNLPLRQALQIFARSYGLNIITHRDAQGTINVEFHDLPFDQAMEALLKAEGLYWQQNGNLISVSAWETRSFTINYIRLVRSGETNSVAKINSGSSESSDSGGESKAGEISVKQSDSVEFWDELEKQLGQITSAEGRILINRMAGTVQVSDYHSRVDEVARFIEQINRAVHRQVDIDVKIVEVALNDDFSLGVDWSRLTDASSSGTNSNLTISEIITQPVGGVTAALPSTALRIFGRQWRYFLLSRDPGLAGTR